MTIRCAPAMSRLATAAQPSCRLSLMPATCSMEPGTDPPGDATALKGCLTGGLILLFFALFGERVLAAFGITLPALRTAGGVLLLLIALDMVFARSSGGTTTTADERAEAAAKQDVSVLPLATPLIAGPGAIGASILLVAEAQGQLVKNLIVIAAMLSVVLLTYLLLLASTHVQKMLGVTALHVVTRIMGVLLAALAVQFVFDGIAASGLLARPAAGGRPDSIC